MIGRGINTLHHHLVNLMLFSVCFIVLALILPETSQFTFQRPVHCTEEQYFDTASLSCRACSTGQALSETGHCKCKYGTIRNLYQDRKASSAEKCSARCNPEKNEVSSETGEYCVYCDPTTGILTTDHGNGTISAQTLWIPSTVTANGSCECSTLTSGYFSTERDSAGTYLRDGDIMVSRCLRCPSSGILETENCRTCPFPKYFSNIDQECHCIEDLNTPVDCYDSHNNKTMLLEELDIDMNLTDEFHSVGRECLIENHIESCNTLANSCVFQLYQRNHPNCQLITAILNERYNPVNSPVAMDAFSETWAEGIPWLWYTESESQWHERNDLTVKLSKQPTKTVSNAKHQLRLILSTYFSNGTWVDFVEVSDELQICGGKKPESFSWRIPGRDFINSCTLHLTDLISAVHKLEGYTYELFLLDSEETLYPIPVKQSINQWLNETTAEKDALTRRFFLAYETSKSDTTITYPEKILLEIYLAPNGKIYPPVLQIRYGKAKQGQDDSSFTTSFSVLYYGDPSASILFTVHLRTCLVTSLITTIFVAAAIILKEAKARQPRTRSWNFFFFSVASLCNILSIALGGTLAYILIFFWQIGVKLRNDFKIVAKDSEEFQQEVFTLVLVALLCQLVFILYSFFQQVTYDLYFIDWENPQRILNFETGMETNGSISCWRTLFVANEWNEVSTERNYPTCFAALLVVFILEGLSIWDGPEKSNPYLHETRIIRTGRVLGTYILVIVMQILMVRIYTQFIRQSSLSQFVDLLFIANISCLMMDTPFSGYYLHGRNQCQHSDISLKNLNDVLTQENDGLIAQRGLDIVHNHDQQVYKCFLCIDDYQNLYGLPLHGQFNVQMEKIHLQHGNDEQTEITIQQKSHSDSVPLIKSIIRDIENNSAEQVLFYSLFHQLFAARPDLSLKKSLLMSDGFHSFRKLTLQGIELHYCYFELLLFVLMDLCFNKVLICACTVTLFAYVVKLARRWLGEIHISKKTDMLTNFLI